MSQSTFDLFRPPSSDPAVDDLLRYLEGRGWLTARQLHAALGESFNERRLRALAAASGGQILSGQKGYKITREATADERDHAINWLNSQAREMQSRAIKISRVHRGTYR